MRKYVTKQTRSLIKQTHIKTPLLGYAFTVNSESDLALISMNVRKAGILGWICLCGAHMTIGFQIQLVVAVGSTRFWCFGVFKIFNASKYFKEKVFGKKNFFSAQ